MGMDSLSRFASVVKDIDVLTGVTKAGEAISKQIEAKNETLLAILTSADAGEEVSGARTRSKSELPANIKTKDVKKSEEVKKTEEAHPEKEVDDQSKKFNKDAEDFAQGKPLFKGKAELLKDLGTKINKDDKPDSILTKVKESFPKATASEIFDVLEFLSKAITDTTTKEIVETARDNFKKANKDRIEDGRTVENWAIGGAAVGGGDAQKLYGFFTDIVSNENNAPDLYKQLSAQYPRYADLKKMLIYVEKEAGMALHDSKIEKPFLRAINNKIHGVQSIIMIYRGFELKMPQMEKQLVSEINRFNSNREAYYNATADNKPKN